MQVTVPRRRMTGITALRRPALAVLAALAGVALLGAPAPAFARTPTIPANVKYYVVLASYQGQPERLAAIAQRFLGTAGRSGEIFDLNYGRLQLDGGRLTDPNVLHPGWALVLPWDAIGTEIVIGPLPTRPAQPPPSRPPPSPSAGPTVTRPANAAGLASCTRTSARGSVDVPWPQLRLAPDQIWALSRGEGVTVAVVDLPVDTSAPGLTDGVAGALTIGTGKATSGAGCDDHGTAMAALLAGRPRPGVGLVGMAPQAMILPVNVDIAGDTFAPAQVAAGIAAGVRAGVDVVMVAVPVDLARREIAAAVEAAIASDVVVVVGAYPSGGAFSARPGLLRVGAASADDALALPYNTGAVDVMAPGIAVTATGSRGAQIEGSGTDFAVPFVAGLVALVRSAAPEMTAVAVTRHVEATADRMASPMVGQPTGWGLIDVTAAVTRLPGPPAVTSADNAPPAGMDRRVLLTIALAALLVAWIAVIRLRRREPRGRRDEVPDGHAASW